MSASQNAMTELDTCSRVPSGDSGPLWSLFDDSSTCVAQLDLQLRLVGANAGFADVFELPVEVLPGRALVELVHASVRDKLTWRLLSLARGERSRFTERIVTLNGTRTATVELTGIAVTNDAERVESLVIVLQPEQAADAADAAVAGPADKKRPLTRMDALVLEGVAAGMSTVQLAAKLFLSRGGVEYHVSALMRNLQASNRSELVSKAYSAGLFSVGSWPPRVVTDFIE